MTHSGYVYDIIEITPSITQIVVKRKHDNYYVNIGFLAKFQVNELVQSLGIEKKDLVKITYYIQSKKYKDKYYTEAIIKTIEIKQKRNPQISVDFETGEIL
jgi:hypothetical protein